VSAGLADHDEQLRQHFPTAHLGQGLRGEKADALILAPQHFDQPVKSHRDALLSEHPRRLRRTS